MTIPKQARNHPLRPLLMQLHQGARPDRGGVREEPAEAGEAVLAEGGAAAHGGGVLAHSGVQTGECGNRLS